MSQYRDLIARMAVDAEFAQHARAHPDEVATQYGLTPDETEQLRGLADASASAGPTALGARLSKSGISTGLLTGFVVAQPDPVEPSLFKPVYDPTDPIVHEEPPPPPPPQPLPIGDHLSDILGNHVYEVVEEPEDPPWQLPDHIDPLDVIEGLPDFPPGEETPPPPPPVDETPPPPPPPPPVDTSPPPPPPAPPADPITPPASATPDVPASPVTDVTGPADGGTGGGATTEPLQVGAPTTDTPGGEASPATAAAAAETGSGIGAQEIIIGGVGLVAGALAGGVAGAVAGKALGGTSADPDDEKTAQGLGPATA